MVMRSLLVRIPTRRRVTAGPHGPTLSTRSRRTGSFVTVRAAGEIDLVTAPMFQEILERARLGVRPARGHADLMVDLREVTFLSAAGISVLTLVHLECVVDGTTMRILGDHPAVRHPLELTGLSRLLTNR
jgi:anti-sigma B factor antagonist